MSHVDYREILGKQIFALSGDFTYKRRIDLAGHTIPYIKPGDRVVFDLGGVTHLDSTFIAEMVLIVRNLQNVTSRISIISAPEKFERLLEVTNTRDHFYKIGVELAEPELERKVA